MSQAYILIDSQGAVLEGTYVPISHRFYTDKGDWHGIESIAKFFGTPQDLVAFLRQLKPGCQGIQGNLSWKSE